MLPAKLLTTSPTSPLGGLMVRKVGFMIMVWVLCPPSDDIYDIPPEDTHKRCFLGIFKKGCTWGGDFTVLPMPTPPDGDWFLGLYGYYHPLHDDSLNYLANGLSLEFSSPLEEGKTYQLVYYAMNYKLLQDQMYELDVPAPLFFGLSEDRATFGDTIYRSPEDWPYGVWQGHSFVFTANIAPRHLTVTLDVPITDSINPTTDNGHHKYIMSLDNFYLLGGSVGFEEHLKSKLKVHPNHFAETLHIETNGSRIGIYDMLGKLQYEQEVVPAQEVGLDLGTLPIGVYILKAFDDYGQELSSEKVIKIRK